MGNLFAVFQTFFQDFPGYRPVDSFHLEVCIFLSGNPDVAEVRQDMSKILLSGLDGLDLIHRVDGPNGV